jgi:hypothetical protein
MNPHHIYVDILQSRQIIIKQNARAINVQVAVWAFLDLEENKSLKAIWQKFKQNLLYFMII